MVAGAGEPAMCVPAPSSSLRPNKPAPRLLPKNQSRPFVAFEVAVGCLRQTCKNCKDVGQMHWYNHTAGMRSAKAWPRLSHPLPLPRRAEDHSGAIHSEKRSQLSRREERTTVRTADRGSSSSSSGDAIEGRKRADVRTGLAPPSRSLPLSDRPDLPPLI